MGATLARLATVAIVATALFLRRGLLFIVTDHTLVPSATVDGSPEATHSEGPLVPSLEAR
ncbi:MAG TPA: hypothetical protein VFQ61_00560 [Polyangiaceae bacterium]|nr:hypothetical protein [Polyangiaceae bacterium]